MKILIQQFGEKGEIKSVHIMCLHTYMYAYINGQMCAHIQAHILVEMVSNYATFPGDKVR